MAINEVNEINEENLNNSKLLKYKSYSLHNIHKIPYLDEYCTTEQLEAIKVVSNVLPFKTNNYVTEKLIHWNENILNDPIFILNFPQKDMLLSHHYNLMKETIANDENDHGKINEVANKIRYELNPQPAGQKSLNVPRLSTGEILTGSQHKYRETLLFFPAQGQTCHAYCSFCFRWPQFVGIKELRFANKQAEQLVQYVQEHIEIQDVLFTGGDPMVMRTNVLKQYIKPLIESDIKHLKTIRIGTKSLSYWPNRYTTDTDSEAVIDLFRDVNDADINLSIMAHFNHPRELSTPEVVEAVNVIKSTGAQIRTQSPLLKNINNKPEIWSKMWRKQVNLSMIPYYMFIVRDTGARHYFEVPILEAWNIFHKAYQKVSGICRTVRGPSMSATPGKIQMLGPAKVGNEKVMVLRFLQGRNPDWVTRPFFAKYDPKAYWLDDLKPAFNEKQFFYEEELKNLQTNNELWFKDDTGLQSDFSDE
jgi:KamA family protein